MVKKNKRRISSLLFGVLIILILIIILVSIQKRIDTLNRVTLPIDTKEEAIIFAKTDSNFSNAIKDFEYEFRNRLIYNSYFDEKTNTWQVSVWPEGTIDLWYYVEFNKNGDIIKKGYGEGG
ncbi:Uncharacterised protein [uncultured archaeon]|nr:Uncharacterised protein [uncultured archaeon]